MEQKIRFGLVLGWLELLREKNWASYEQLLERIFHGFMGKKITLKYCSVRTKKLYK